MTGLCGIELFSEFPRLGEPQCVPQSFVYDRPMLTLIVALVMLSPHAQLWICNPGRTPYAVSANCEHLHYSVLTRIPPSELRR